MSGKEYDIFRDSIWRYLGYAHEFGEVLGQNSHCGQPTAVKASYLVTISYILADTIHKSFKSLKTDQSGSKSKKNQKAKDAGTSSDSMGKIVYKAGDALIWQMLASVIIPGFIINRFAYTTSYLMKGARAPKNLIGIIPSIVGVGILPLISSPIDRFVDKIMDSTYRKQNQNQSDNKSNKK